MEAQGSPSDFMAGHCRSSNSMNSIQNPTLVVMAAGMGSRYGGLKQLDPVGPNGELIIHYSVYDALRSGFDKVAFIIREDIETAFREHIGGSIEKQCETVYVHQKTTDAPPGLNIPIARQKPWGTAHAVYAARSSINTPFAVINADDFYGRAAFQVLGNYLQNSIDPKNAYCMVGYRLANTLTEYGHVSRGVCEIDTDDYLLGIEERLRIQKFGDRAMYTEDGENWVELPMDSTVSMNMWGFPPSFLDELSARFPRFIQLNRANLQKAEYLLPNVVGDLLGEHKTRVKVLRTDAQWHGVTYREDAPLVRQAIRSLVEQGVYPANLQTTA